MNIYEYFNNNCVESEFGCCSDGDTSKIDSEGTNCSRSLQFTDIYQILFSIMCCCIFFCFFIISILIAIGNVSHTIDTINDPFNFNRPTLYSVLSK